MAIVILLQSSPRLTSGAIAPVKLAGGGSKAYDQLGVTTWRAGIAAPPRFTTAIGFDKGGPTGGAIPQTGGIRFFSSDKDYASALSNLVWQDAAITIASGDDEDAAPVYTTILNGTVADAKSAGGAINLTISDLSANLNRPAAPNTFAGTGDLEGGDEATGRVKRASFGLVFNVEGRLLDRVNNIYEFGDPSVRYGITGFLSIKDRGLTGPTVALAWQGSALATLNALRSATVPQGGAVVAPDIQCVKWWTVPAGPLTADFNGGYGANFSPADLASVLLGTLAPGTTTIANLAEATGWVNRAAGVHIDDASETIGNVLDRLLLPLFIVWILRADGVLGFRRISFATPAANLDAETIEREAVFPPLRTRRLGFQRNYRQHSDGEISATVIEAGNDPTYSDGTPIDVLRPAEAGANVTESRTAAAILGQAATATSSDFAAVTGSTKPSNNADVTGDNTAAAIAGQAATATSSDFAVVTGTTKPEPNATVGANVALNVKDGVAILTRDQIITLLGTSAGFLGQGALATANAVAYAQIVISSLRRQDSDSDGATYTNTAYGTTIQATGLTATLSEVYPSGDIYIDFTGNVAMIPPGGQQSALDSIIFLRVTYPNGATSEHPVQTLTSIKIPSTQTGTHTVGLFLRKGDTQIPPENGSPGSGIYSPSPQVSATTLAVVWRAI